MTQRCVADDQRGKYYKRVNGILEKIDRGPLDFLRVMKRLQDISDETESLTGIYEARVDCRISFGVLSEIAFCGSDTSCELLAEFSESRYDVRVLDIRILRPKAMMPQSDFLQLLNHNTEFKFEGSTPEEAQYELNNTGFRFASPHEMLCLSIQHPKVLGEHRIHALGGRSQGVRNGKSVTFSDHDGERRISVTAYAGSPMVFAGARYAVVLQLTSTVIFSVPTSRDCFFMHEAYSIIDRAIF